MVQDQKKTDEDIDKSDIENNAVKDKDGKRISTMLSDKNED